MECRRYLRRLGVLVLVAGQLRLFVSAQDCLQAAGGRAPPFRDDNHSPYLPSGTQAIITSYKFECCGNITAWQTYVQPGGKFHQKAYDITFQVWRPSPTAQENECYSLVGENRFTSLSLGGGGLVSETPKPTNTLTVQPMDVVGYFTFSRKDPENSGLQLDTSSSVDNLWYHTNTDTEPLTAEMVDNCPFLVGAEPDRTLTTSTNAAAVLSVSVSSFSCPHTHTITASSSQLPSISATTISIHTVSMSTSPTLSPGDSPAMNTAVIASLTVVGGSALLLTLLCILVLAITLAKARQRRQGTLAEILSIAADRQVNLFSMRMQQNEAYTPTSHGADARTINMETNLAYKVVTMKGDEVTMPESSLTESHAYESVTTRSELCTSDEHHYIHVI